ncbi:MAG: aquaporin [Candidatus Micrarchaeota archaeon]|nr:aquaporin [Candidatus Micrarchaeota archaeon]
MAKTPRLGQRALVEFIGTLIFVFVGAGSVVAVNSLSPTYPGLLIIALANGIGLALAVTFAMNISGGHMNPAVTIGMLVTRKIKALDSLAYIIAQLLGATAGALLLVALMPGASGAAVHYGTPALAPSVGLAQGIALEAVMTAFLVFMVFGTAVDSRAPRVGGFGIGLMVALDVIVGGSLTGAAMNPARAMGPAIASMSFANWYVYWIGPIIGAVVAALVYSYCVQD